MVRPITEPGCVSALDLEFEVGNYVAKRTGEAIYEGWVVSKYLTRRGKLRYVVEINPQGFQMIASPGFLTKANENETA